MRILMIFLDGIGLGADDPAINPFAAAHTPTLWALANGHRWVATTGQQTSDRAVFIPTDPRMGVPGRPQSGTGQATILTGINVPQYVGEHYGPKPNQATRQLLAETNFFKEVVEHGLQAALLEAYPPPWHKGINSGKRLRASFQQAAHEAGLPMLDIEALNAGKALAGDWTGEAWREQLGYADAPVYSRFEAGHKLVEIARGYQFSFCSHWMTDIVGHRGTLADGVALLEKFDGVMAGVLDAWDESEGVVIVTSDHGNMEDMSHRKHTCNDVPTVIIGAARDAFCADFSTLADLVPVMRRLLFRSPAEQPHPTDD
jgi:2,3-bisphosphoglycerate-independent phosphoglycerate mutase